MADSSGLRQRRSVAKATDDAAPAPEAKEVPKEVEIDPAKGFYGVTVSSSDLISGVNVDAVHPKDLFAAAGLKAGDVIVSLDGEEVDNHERAMIIMELAQCDAKKKLKVMYVSKAYAEAEAARSAAKWARRRGCCGKFCFTIFAVIALLLTLNFTKSVPGSSDGSLRGNPVWAKLEDKAYEPIAAFQKRMVEADERRKRGEADQMMAQMKDSFKDLKLPEGFDPNNPTDSDLSKIELP